jgi:hypothetical protein
MRGQCAIRWSRRLAPALARLAAPPALAPHLVVDRPRTLVVE